MLQKIISWFNEISLFTASYSNTVFPEPLSSEEEDMLIDMSKNGDDSARSRLIEHNLRLVAHIVKKFEHSGADQDDLISIGTIGLIKGVDSFSKSKGTKITTYCARCIENEILMYFRANSKNSKNVSINESIGYDKEGNEITILDVLKMPSSDFADEIETRDNIKLLTEYFHVLTQREKRIIEERYGLNNCEEKTQKEIAKNMGISRSYVSRIEKRALTKILREFIKNNKVSR